MAWKDFFTATPQFQYEKENRQSACLNNKIF